MEKIFTKHVPEAVGFIQASADSINHMIKNLLEVAKAGTVPINIQALDMNALLANVAVNAKMKLNEAEGRLEMEDLPQCRGDAVQMTHVFTKSYR